MAAALIGVFVLVSVSSLTTADYSGDSYHNRHHYRPYDRPVLYPFPGHLPVTRPPAPVDPGTTPNIMKLSEEDDRQASEKGVKVPSGDCITSWNDFKEFVIDREWISLYILDDDEDIPANRGVAFKFSARWRLVNETIINRQGSIWWTGTNTCIFPDGIFQRVDDNKAIFGGITGNAFVSSTRRDIFVCSKTNPITWCIFYICYDFDKVVDGRCPNSETVLMVREQRDGDIQGDGTRQGQIRLNDIPWSEIATAYKDCLGQEFKDDTDPQLRWNWVTPNDIDCPVPGTPAFQAGVANG